MIVDSHLHVWSDSGGTYADGKEPPSALGGETSSAEALIALMDQNGVDASLIVQPSNYMFDHSYVMGCMAKFPGRFGCMMLLDPCLDPDEACATVRNLAAQGIQ